MAFWNKDQPSTVETTGPQTSSLDPKGPLIVEGENVRGKYSNIPDQKTANPDDLLTQRYGKIRSALGQGTVIQGKLSFDTPVRIDGKLSGEIYSTQTLIVGPTGQIDAFVEVASLVVMGSVKGKIKASTKVELCTGGRLNGDVSTPIFVIEEGCEFSGNSAMLSFQAKKEANEFPLKTEDDSKSTNASTQKQKDEFSKKIPPAQSPILQSGANLQPT